jgi:tetratricopeptide (TPR) repeat protein
MKTDKKVVVGILLVVAVLIFAVFRHSPPTKSHEAILLESKGLLEFSSENDAKNAMSAEQIKVYKKVADITELSGDGKDQKKLKEGLESLSKLIKQYPNYPDLYFLRATYLTLTDDKDYQRIVDDLNQTLEKYASKKKGYEGFLDSVAPIYTLRAKMNIALRNYPEAMNDLETALNVDPSSPNDVFNTGGTKPEDNSNPTAIQKVDIDKLVSMYPNDYRVYVFRGLFYKSFSTFNTEYQVKTASDLKRAAELKPDSALVQYLLGNAIQEVAFWAFDMSANQKNQFNRRSIEYLNEAIKLDPKFTYAYAASAEAFSKLKDYGKAIENYEKVVELNPNNTSAYNDKALAEVEKEDYYSAIRDFTKAIENQKVGTDNDLYAYHRYENRGDAYVKVENYPKAIEDYSNAIGINLANSIIIMSLSQIRKLYPELSDIPDADLAEALRQKYYPNQITEDFKKQLEKNESDKPYSSFILGDLVVKRGDTYLSDGKFKKALAEYARLTRAFPSYVIDRWKAISKDKTTEYFIDIQTVDYNDQNVATFWLKAQEIDSAIYYQQNLKLDCPERKIKSISSTRYNALGNGTSMCKEQEWQGVIPDTLGEILYNHVCSS